MKENIGNWLRCPQNTTHSFVFSFEEKEAVMIEVGLFPPAPLHEFPSDTSGHLFISGKFIMLFKKVCKCSSSENKKKTPPKVKMQIRHRERGQETLLEITRLEQAKDEFLDHKARQWRQCQIEISIASWVSQSLCSAKHRHKVDILVKVAVISEGQLRNISKVSQS